MDEIGEDLVVDDFNIKEVQMRLPARKHFWVARLMDAKVEKNKLLADSPVKVTQSVAEQHAERHDTISNVNTKIYECDTIIEYLEKVEKVLSQMSYDISNIVKIQQMEQL